MNKTSMIIRLIDVVLNLLFGFIKISHIVFFAQIKLPASEQDVSTEEDEKDKEIVVVLVDSKLQKEGGGEGRRAITRLTRLITFGWALIQSSSIAFYLKRALFDWSPLLAFEIILWLTTGAMIVLWLSELITEYGLGNGASLLI